MILIADSGSTKTDWVLNDRGEITGFQTQGFNPYLFSTSEKYTLQLKSEFPSALLSKSIDQIAFYGTGCSTDQNKKFVTQALQGIYPSSIIEVNHDLIGAARGLCGHNAGIVCILGTGSNACLFDGEKIISKDRNLGYVLGDEGSGANLGKKLVIAFLHEEMPEQLMKKFYDQYKVNREIILQKVYKEPFPNRYLASFSTFLYEHLAADFCSQLVKDAFSQFFEIYITKIDHYLDYKVNVTGSIGYYFRTLLEEVAAGYGINLGRLLQSPMAGLIEYHQQ